MGEGPAALLINSGGTEIGTASNPVRTDTTGTTTQPVSATALPLPTNAATSAKQDTGNTSLSNIDGKLPALVSSRVPVDGSGVTQPISATALPLPTGAATSALQGTGNTSLGNIDTKLPASIGQKAMAASLPVVLASDQSAIPVTGTFSAGVIPNPDDTTGTIVAAGGTVAATVEGWSSCAAVITGTWVATLVFEFSHDGGTTWSMGGFVRSSNTSSPIPALLGSVDANGSYQTIGMGPTTSVRVRAALYTSGTVNVRLVFSNAMPAMQTGFAQIQQNVSLSLKNSSTTNLAAGAAFTGTAESTLGIAAIAVNVIASQPIDLQIQQGPDGTNWDVIDDQDFLAGQGDSRIYQTTSAFFRAVATNIGNATTSYLRLQVALTPVAVALPRALTPAGRLRIASMTDSFYPDPAESQDRTQSRALLMDVERNLRTRSLTFTDEASFRSDFTQTDNYVDLTGTVYFTNGSAVVTGVGTAFTSEVNQWRYIKQSTHADTAYTQVAEVLSDTQLCLEEVYPGATASGTGRVSNWLYAIGSGGSIAQSSSLISLLSGTTSGTIVSATRYGDYLPFVITTKASITQRIANQEAHVGLADGVFGSIANQALVVFDGTTNTTVKFRTSFSASDIEETTVTLPGGAVTSTAATYVIEVYASKCVLFINGVKLAEHQLHIPGPYSPMDCHICIKNTGTAAGSTTLSIDTYHFTNFDQVQIGTFGKGDPITTKELRANASACTNVSAAVADTVILANNANRMGACVYNDSVATLYLKMGTGASTTSYTTQLGKDAYWECPFGYTGPINGYWSAATGTARVTEVL